MPLVEIVTNFHVEVADKWDADGKAIHETRRQYVRSEKVEVSEEQAEDWRAKGLAEPVTD